MSTDVLSILVTHSSAYSLLNERSFVLPDDVLAASLVSCKHSIVVDVDTTQPAALQEQLDQCIRNSWAEVDSLLVPSFK